MIKHERDAQNTGNHKIRFELLRKWKDRVKNDGLNSLNTNVDQVIKYFTHTRLYIKINPDQPLALENFICPKEPATYHLEIFHLVLALYHNKSWSTSGPREVYLSQRISSISSMPSATM